MSLESFLLISVLTLLAITLGTNLFLLLVGLPALNAVSDLTFLEMMGHIHQSATYRILIVLGVLMVGAVSLNLIEHNRTEVYLLRIGLGALATCLVLMLLGSKPLSDKIIEALESGSTADVRSWHKMLEQWLWTHTVASLVSFWSFLHYAMNPKV